VILHVRTDEGDGPPLVLLHGWPQHAGMWDEVVPSLKTRFRCIAMDLRGFGGSPAPEDGYDKPTLTADVLETLDDLGIEQARFVGHDWGAVVTSIVATDHPERMVKGLMFSVPTPWEPSFDPRGLLGIAHMPVMASPLGPHVGPGLARRVMILSGVSEAAADDYVAPLREPARAQASSRLYRTFLLQELPDALRSPRDRPSVPVRVVGGDRDPVCRWAKLDERVAGAGHFIVDTHPEVVVEEIKSFL
jgi:pimeloyl-ACP methyl ester carboxylesterase